MSVTLYSPSVSPLDMQDGRRVVRQIDEHTFRVLGRQGTRYDVRVESGVPRCPCERGSRGLSCWHAARVLARLERDGVSRPAPAPFVADPFEGL